MFKKVFLVFSISCGLIFCMSPKESFADVLAELEQAEAYDKDRLYDQAEAAYQAIVTNYPGTDYALKAQKELVVLYKHEQPQAGVALAKLVTDFSTNDLIAKTVYELAGNYYESKSYQKFKMTKVIYKSILDNWPTSEEAMWARAGLAVSNVSLGEIPSANTNFQKLVVDFSKQEDIEKACYKVAHQYNRFWKYKEAEQLYQYLMDNWPSSKGAVWNLIKQAHSAISNEDYTTAKAAVDQLLAGYSSYEFMPGAIYDIAEHYQRYKRYEEAKQLYQHIVDNSPTDYYGIWSQMGVALTNILLNNEAAVQSALDKLSADYSDNPRIADAVLALATLYTKLEQHEKAKQIYLYVLNHWPKDEHYGIWAQFHVAISDMALGQNDAAKAIVDNAFAKLEAGDVTYSYWPSVAAELYYHIGKFYCQFGEYSNAITCYQKLIDNYSNHYRVASGLSSLGLARAYIALGDNAKAKTLIDATIARLNANFQVNSDLPIEVVETYYRTGNTYHNLGEYEKSIQCHQKLVDANPAYEYLWDSQFMVGRNYESLKKEGTVSESEADKHIRAAYEQLLEKYPECPAAKHARSWLSR